MDYKTQIQTYLKDHKRFVWFIAGASFMLAIVLLTLIALWQQKLQTERQRLSYVDVFPEVNQLVKGREVKATVVRVMSSQNIPLIVKLDTTGKKVPVNVNQNTEIKKRVPKDKETIQEENEEFQEKIRSGNLKGVKQPKSYTTENIELASVSKGQNVVIKPRGNIVGKLQIDARTVSVVQTSSE